MEVLDAEAADIGDRDAALRDQLPGESKVEKARQEATELQEQHTAAAAEFSRVWAAYLDALSAAERAARRVAEARGEAQNLSVRLRSLRTRYSLDGVQVATPKANRQEAKLAGKVGALLRDFGYSQEWDRAVDAEVASARRAVETTGQPEAA